jgi:hypothetical protein
MDQVKFEEFSTQRFLHAHPLRLSAILRLRHLEFPFLSEKRISDLLILAKSVEEEGKEDGRAEGEQGEVEEVHCWR